MRSARTVCSTSSTAAKASSTINEPRAPRAAPESATVFRDRARAASIARPFPQGSAARRASVPRGSGNRRGTIRRERENDEQQRTDQRQIKVEITGLEHPQPAEPPDSAPDRGENPLAERSRRPPRYPAISRASQERSNNFRNRAAADPLMCSAARIPASCGSRLRKASISALCSAWA